MEMTKLRCPRCKELVSNLGPGYIVGISENKIVRKPVCNSCAEALAKLKK